MLFTRHGKVERKGLNEINLITALEVGIREMGGDGLKPTENFETITGKLAELPLPQGWWRI